MDNSIIFEDERIDEVNEKLRLIQKKDGLTFGTDAFLLAAYIKKQRYATAAELGCGTGIISLLCAAREKFATVHAFEIQEDFARLTERNIALNGLGDKIIPHCADIRSLSSEDTDGEVDAVFSNPPYMLANSGKPNMSEAKNIARHETCGGISDFCACARRLLKHGGRFYCVWRPDRLTALFSAMTENRLEPKEMVFVHADINTPPSMVLVCAKKGGAPSLSVAPPLILHEVGQSSSGRALTDAAQRIYDTMSFTE
ncbi:MAG: methyltransferase [Clostridia bacterium]|nr:methyltransferase [Clostridia bacterium]